MLIEILIIFFSLNYFLQTIRENSTFLYALNNLNLKDFYWMSKRRFYK